MSREKAFDTHNDHPIPVEGTWYQGEIRGFSVDDLVRAFGKPLGPMDKSRFNWDVQMKDGTVFTVYDWKESGPDQSIRVWNVGGKDPEVVALAESIVREARWRK